jgi:glutathione S-transferase
MAALPRVTFFHAPNSRSGGARALLEELGAPYDMTVLNLRKGEQRDAKYLAVNPMGKVPAILHEGQLVTEQGAVFTYLADLYPQAGLAPALGDPLRGPYLRWMFFYGSCFEPAVVDRSQKNTPAPASTCPYGDFDTMLKTVSDQLKKGPWMLGDKFTALDVLYGGALRWTVGFNLVPATPEIKAYIERVAARPAIQRAAAADTELAASQPS